MIHEVVNWAIGKQLKRVDRGIFAFPRYEEVHCGDNLFVSKSKHFSFSIEDMNTILAQSNNFPVLLGRDGEIHNKRYWLYKNKLYWENDGYESQDMKLILDQKIKQNLKKIERLRKEPLGKEAKRDIIPDEVKIFVWNRDCGVCVQCGSNQKLEYDHIIPISKGGSNTARNIQLLCEECNRKKGGEIT
jgi:hypothetical protein